LYIVFGIGLDGFLFGFGTVYLPNDMLIYQSFLDGPRPQGRQSSVVVQESLFAEMVLSSQEGTYLVGGNSIDGWIFIQEVLQAAESVGVVCDGMGTETPCISVQKVSFNRI